MSAKRLVRNGKIQSSLATKKPERSLAKMKLNTGTAQTQSYSFISQGKDMPSLGQNKRN